MQKFVAEENIAGYRRWLEEDGAEGVTRATLLKLWLRDAKILGLTREQLTRIDRHIEKLRRLIAKQSESLAETGRLATVLGSPCDLQRPHGDLSGSSPKDSRRARGRQSLIHIAFSTPASQL
jgi:hypothetical protein